jgi:hypothetical protein
MSSPFRAALVLWLASLVTSAAQSTPQAEATTLVKATVAEALQLLEAKNMTAFLKLVVPPDQVIAFAKQFGTLETAGAELAKGKDVPVLLDKFRAASKVEPTFSEDGFRANFPFPEIIGNDRRLQFSKIGEKWYMTD